MVPVVWDASGVVVVVEGMDGLELSFGKRLGKEGFEALVLRNERSGAFFEFLAVCVGFVGSVWPRQIGGEEGCGAHGQVAVDGMVGAECGIGEF